MRPPARSVCSHCSPCATCRSRARSRNSPIGCSSANVAARAMRWSCRADRCRQGTGWRSGATASKLWRSTRPDERRCAPGNCRTDAALGAGGITRCGAAQSAPHRPVVSAGGIGRRRLAHLGRTASIATHGARAARWGRRGAPARRTDRFPHAQGLGRGREPAGGDGGAEAHGNAARARLAHCGRRIAVSIARSVPRGADPVAYPVLCRRAVAAVHGPVCARRRPECSGSRAAAGHRGTQPPRAERYWRGPVLHEFDGYTWRRIRADFGSPPPLEFAGRGYRYEVTLEPNTHGVLIALELPRGVPVQPPSVFATFDYQLIGSKSASSAISYRLESFPQHRSLEALSPDVRALDLALPRARNPRSLELAHSLRAAAKDERAYVKAVLDYLQQGGFEYTLTPPRLNLNSIDDLLFNTHEGFCGHYASAFAMLMRAGGIPAHVVTGYLAGEWNRFGN